MGQVTEVICNQITNPPIYDWFKDIIIPTVGAIAIPLLVWGLSWLFGAVRAEKKKELRELRDNLNLILSISLDAIQKLISLRETWLNLNKIEKKYETVLGKVNIKDFSEDDWIILAQTYMIPLGLEMINVANYSPCIAISENYVLHLIKLMSAYKIILFKIESRNYDVKKICECDNLELKTILIRERIAIDIREFDDFMKTLTLSISCLKSFINETKELENKYKGLILDTVKYTEEYNNYFKELEDSLKKDTTK